MTIPQNIKAAVENFGKHLFFLYVNSLVKVLCKSLIKVETLVNYLRMCLCVVDIMTGWMRLMIAAGILDLDGK